MATQPKVLHDVPADALTVLKPQKLGRHYHKIPIQVQEAASKNPRLISDYFLINYRINIELDTVKVHDHYAQPADCIYQTELGRIGFSIDRRLLTEALESYYGGSGIGGGNMPPISASEQRMRTRLGMNIANMFARTMLAGASFAELDEYGNDYEQVSWEFVAEFAFHCHSSNSKASILLYLDAALVDAFLSRLSRPGRARGSACPEESIKQLPVRLDCVIADTLMPLGQVLGLEPGDILVLRPLERYEVRINQQTLFRGTIFEEGGALYLTSLESVTS